VENPTLEQQDRLANAVEAHELLVRNILSQLPVLGLAIQNDFNVRRDELEQQLRTATARSAHFGVLAIWLYVIGSMVAVYGQVADKMIKVTAGTPAASA